MSPMPDETMQLINKAHKLGLSDREGTVFAGVAHKRTFQNRRNSLGLQATNKPRHGKPERTMDGIVEEMRGVRAAEGIEGVGSKTMQERHAGLYNATLHYFGNYSDAFEATFGFPFSKGAMYLAMRIHELKQSGKGVDHDALSTETNGFRKVIRAGHFDSVYKFVTEEPVVRKRTKREIHEVLARMVLNYMPKPGSSVTPNMKIFPGPYMEEAAHLLEYAGLLGLVVPISTDGIPVYRASDSAVESARKMLLSLDSITGEFDAAPLIWWNSVHETQTMEGEALRYIDRALEGVSDQDKWLVQHYLCRALCNPHTYNTASNTYEPRNPDFKRAAIVTDVVMKYRGEGIPPELRATLQLLPAEDYRTADTLGRYLLGNVTREVGLERLRRMSVQSNAQAVYRGVWEAAGKYA